MDAPAELVELYAQRFADRADQGFGFAVLAVRQSYPETCRYPVSLHRDAYDRAENSQKDCAYDG